MLKILILKLIIFGKSLRIIIVGGIEEFEDIKLYDEAKKEDGGSSISLEDYLNKRKSPY